jgi:hypothetical protein
MFDPSSRNRLTSHDLARFPSDRLFDRIGRAVSAAGCLPRKELFEAWEMGRRVRRLFRGGRVVDLGGGHGLLAQILLVLDATSDAALVVDTALPPSHDAVHQALVQTWPRLAARVTFARSDIAGVDVRSGDLVVSSHACGDLTDRILALASSARARVAVLPCCHNMNRAGASDDGGLAGWMSDGLAIDAVRALRLRDRGYRVWTQTIPAAITPKNRLLIGEPCEDVAAR